MVRFLKYLGLSTLLMALSIGQSHASSSETSTDDLWLTGPLITASARVIPEGHVNVEPYLFSIVNTGFYNSDWKAKKISNLTQVTPQFLIKAGLIENLAFTTIIQSFYNKREHQQNSGFNDMPIGFDYQVYKGEHSTFVRFSLQEILPIGKHDNLNIDSLGTDIGGTGSFITVPSIGASTVFHIGGEHFCRPRMNIGYAIPAPTRVRGANFYGGDPTTRGKVYPGNSLNFACGVEYTLTKKWALALDLTGQYNRKSKFHGTTQLPCGLPSSVQYTVAPAIEYNWSPNMGLIVGYWFTIAGRNTPQFYSAAAAYNYYF